MKIKINDKEYIVEVAETEDQKEIGLQNMHYLPEDEGMLFIYDEPEDIGFWMEDTYIPLNEADYKEIRDTVVGESLFISPKGWRSVEIFLKVLGKTVEWHLYDTEWSTPYFIKRIEELKFIHYNIQISKYF